MTPTRQPLAQARPITPNAADDFPLPWPVFTSTREPARLADPAGSPAQVGSPDWRDACASPTAPGSPDAPGSVGPFIGSPDRVAAHPSVCPARPRLRMTPSG